MDPDLLIASSSVVLAIVLGVWRMNASHNKRTDQLRRDMRADMERMEENRRTDMEKMEENRRTDMEKMEENRRTDMERMEENMRNLRREVLTSLEKLSEAVAKLDSRVSYIEGMLDRKHRRETQVLDAPANPV